MRSTGEPPAPDRTVGTDRRRELGAFLRSRRARLRPEDVGLGSWGMRRVPGLRREEVAHLANVGLTWYTWLEQGRDVQPSDAVLHAIADALRLDTFEREHLLELARDHRSGGDRPARDAPDSRELTELVRGFEPTPAYVISPRFDVLAHNRAAALLFGDLDPGPAGLANMMRLGFTDPAWRELIIDWDQEAARHVAMYRAAMRLHLNEPAWTELPDELAARSPAFAHYWARSDVAGPERRIKRFRHPVVGEMTLHSTSLLLAEDPTVRIVVLAASGPADAEKLARLGLTFRED
jgi:transcriptional regulator with XRE-family HTH domain